MEGHRTRIGEPVETDLDGKDKGGSKPEPEIYLKKNGPLPHGYAYVASATKADSAPGWKA